MHYAWIIAFTGTLVVLLGHGFSRMSYSILLPPMKEGLLLTYSQAGLIGTANFIGYLCLAVVGGLIAVRFGARRTIFVSLIVMGISLFLTGLSNSFDFAFLMRLITGMGNGGSYIPMMALPAAWFASRKRGLAMGIVTVGTGTGLTILGLGLPPLMGKFGSMGWRYAWCVMGAIVFVLSFVCYYALRDNPAEKGTSMYGGEEERKGPTDVSLFSAWKDLLLEKEIWKLGSIYFMWGLSYIIYLTFFMAYLTHEMALAPAKAGRMFAIMGLCGILSGVIWGSISDVLGRRYGLVLAYLTLASSFLAFAFWQSIPGFYASAIIFGTCMSSIPAIVSAAIGDVTGGRRAPAALGFVTVFFGVGQSIGPGVAGWMRDATGTFVGGFILSGLAALLGAAGSMMLRKR
jgi:MFS family permease